MSPRRGEDVMVPPADFRSYYGPMHKAFNSLDSEEREALKSDLRGLIDDWNVSGDETAVLPSDYLEVVAVRR